MEELTQTKLQQSRQLAEARQQLYTQERTGGEGGRGKVGRLEEELRTAQCELEKAREREKQVKVQVLKKNSWEIYKTKYCCYSVVRICTPILCTCSSVHSELQYSGC